MAEIEHYDFPQAPRYLATSASSAYSPAGSAFPGYVHLMNSSRPALNYQMSSGKFNSSTGKFSYRA